jgi:hypothetical protein
MDDPAQYEVGLAPKPTNRQGVTNEAYKNGQVLRGRSTEKVRDEQKSAGTGAERRKRTINHFERPRQSAEHCNSSLLLRLSVQSPNEENVERRENKRRQKANQKVATRDGSVGRAGQVELLSIPISAQSRRLVL